MPSQPEVQRSGDPTYRWRFAKGRRNGGQFVGRDERPGADTVKKVNAPRQDVDSSLKNRQQIEEFAGPGVTPGDWSYTVEG